MTDDEIEAVAKAISRADFERGGIKIWRDWEDCPEHYRDAVLAYARAAIAAMPGRDALIKERDDGNDLLAIQRREIIRLTAALDAAVMAEREACAALADESYAGNHYEDYGDPGVCTYRLDIADEIRARSRPALADADPNGT